MNAVTLSDAERAAVMVMLLDEGKAASVLGRLAVGMSNRLIGEQLDISPRTVEIHRANMLTKIGAQHTSEAISIAIEASLVA